MKPLLISGNIKQLKMRHRFIPKMGTEFMARFSVGDRRVSISSLDYFCLRENDRIFVFAITPILGHTYSGLAFALPRKKKIYKRSRFVALLFGSIGLGLMYPLAIDSHVYSSMICMALVGLLFGYVLLIEYGAAVVELRINRKLEFSIRLMKRFILNLAILVTMAGFFVFLYLLK